VVTAVDRAARCVVGHAVVPRRSFEIFQAVVDQGPQAERYFSDGMPAYADVYYRGASYTAMLDKSQTYSVEGDNAELRHYLARLHRSTRYFSKCLTALQRAVDLFVYYWNMRQIRQRAQPNYPVNLINCIALRV
jgi:IS1 family transposase